MSTDGELFAAWRDGDQSAGNKLLGRYFPLLYRFFRNKAGPDTEDLIQQTFLTCVKQRQAFRGDCSFRTFLLRVARTRLYDFIRSRSRQPTADFGVTSVIDLGIGQSAEFARNEVQRAVALTLQALPVDFQVPLELHYWDELSGREISEILEIPEGTVRGRLRRGKELLKKGLEKRLGERAGVDLQACLDQTRDSLKRLETELKPAS